MSRSFRFCSRLIALLAFSLALISQPALSQEQIFRKYLNSDTDTVVWLDLSMKDVESRATLRKVLKVLGPQLEEELGTLSDAGATRISLLGNAVQIASQGPLVIVEGGDLTRLESALRESPGFQGMPMHQAENHLLLAAQQPMLDMALETAKVGASGNAISAKLVEGLDACSNRLGVVVALKPEFSKFLSGLPGTGDNANLAIMVSSLSKLEFAFLTDQAEALNIQIVFSAADAAQSFARAVNQIVRERFKFPDAQSLFVADENRVTLPSQNQDVLIDRMVTEMRQAATEGVAMNNLRQIAIAFHIHESNFQKFVPQALVDRDGNRLLSWRVLLLPYLDQEELYKQFKLDEAWDSPHNRQLISKMPKVYAGGDKGLTEEQIKNGLTPVLAPLTKDTVMGRPGKPLHFADVIDGTSNTILLVQALPEHAVVWTKPDDLLIDEHNPLAALIKDKEGSFLVALLDGSVRKVPGKITADALKAWLTLDGRDIVPNPLNDE